MGAAWYRTQFELPIFSGTHHVLLKFGAVDYFCEVFINGRSAGTHEGGYTPFTFEITNLIRPGANTVVVHVIDPPMDEVQNRALFPDMMYNEIPHGKQNWYVQNSGIWQGVRLELCPCIYIERLDVTPKDNGEFEIEARFAGVGLITGNGCVAAETEFRAAVYDHSGRRVFETSEKLRSERVVRVRGKVADVALWSPESPALYALEVSLSGAVLYHRKTRFGFRSFEAREGRLFLNSKPFYLRAALDQDFYPETVHTPTSAEYVRDMMTKAKRLGFNVLRCHLKVAHPVYLDVADEMGMLIWTELPSWSDSWFPSDHFSAIAAARTDKMFWEILIRDWNHPCIVIQTIMNESWGINLTDAAQRDWLKTTFNRIKGLLAPLGRLVVDNSACEGNFHVKSDLDDFHQYYSMPDQVASWDKWVEKFAQRPDWTFSPHGDAEKTGKEPLLVSEFGNWGLPRLPAELPWWFDVNFGDREITRPSGVLQRFHEYKFDTLFGTFNALADDTQWHQFVSLKHEIESIRMQEPIQGYVITGITDVHWEVNGLLDMWRNEKLHAREIGLLQTPDLIMCRVGSCNHYAGDTITVEPVISHYSDRDIDGAQVRWFVSGQTGVIALSKSVAQGTVCVLASFQITLGKVDRPKVERLQLEFLDRHGERLSENAYDLFVFPKLPAPADRLALSDSLLTSGLRSQLDRAGYEIASLLTEGSLMVASSYDTNVAEWLARGGNVLVLVDSENSLPAGCGIAVKARAGSDLDGRWVSNQNWIRSDIPPFSALALNRILGFESAEVVPEFVLQNVAPSDYQDVLSGITYGWLNKNAALAVQMRVGSGKMLATSFRFPAYGSDPYATRLLDSLISYASGSLINPQMQLPVLAPVR